MKDVIGEIKFMGDPRRRRDGRIESPREVPEAQALIVRLCELQSEVVSEVYGFDETRDCFCGDGGFWPLREGSFRNNGDAVAFIERVVRFTLRWRWLWRWFA